MYRRVDEYKHPDRRAHVSNSGPHTQHCAGMMVSLQRGAPLAFGEDDERVDDFVELADVEHPAPERQTLVPQSPEVSRVWISIVAHVDQCVLRLPYVDCRIERCRVA